MQSQIAVRPANADDKDAVLAFCQKTFSWGDYIAEVWDEWLANTRGKIFVAVVDDKPIGMIHAAFLRDGVAWMEGMRVHPKYRRIGAASAMDAAARAYALESGAMLARLATAESNRAAQKTLAAQGYTQAAQYGEWLAPSTRARVNSVASSDDLPEIFVRWHAVSNAIVANPEWRWERLDDAALSEIQREGKIRVHRNGFAILRDVFDISGNEVILHALVGADDAMLALARSVRAEAKYRGFRRVQAMVLDDAHINRALQGAGFKREGGMYIYEQAL